MTSQIGIYVSFFAYTVFILVVGLYFYNKSKGNLSAYFLAGRSVNPWVTALSAQASDMSAWLFMSLPAVACLYGWQACWIAVGLATGTYLNWRIVARRLRNFSVAFGDSITVPEFLQHRFEDRSPVIRLVCSSIILIFFLLYVASGFSAEAKLFGELFGMEYRTALFLGAGVILFYTFIGGFLAVCWTDFYQGILMFFAILIVPVVVYGHLSEESVRSVFSSDFVSKSLFSSQTENRWGEIVSGLSWGLGYFGMPHILVRFMAIRSSAEIRKSRLIANTWVLLSLAAAIGIGLLGHHYLAAQGITYGSQAEAEKIFMHLSAMLFNPWLTGILFSALLAAVMSTVSAQLLVVGSAIVRDMYCHFNRRSSERTNMLLSRLSIVLVTVVAVGLAWHPDSSVMGFVSYAWSGFAATFAPVILSSLIWKRATLRGIVAGLVTGAVTVIVWESTGIYGLIGLSATLPGFVLATVAIIVVSLCDKRPSETIAATFEQAKKM